MPVFMRSISVRTCSDVPWPVEPKEILFGFAFAYATSSPNVFTGRLGVTPTMFGCVNRLAIRVKSLSIRYGSCLAVRAPTMNVARLLLPMV